MERGSVSSVPNPEAESLLNIFVSSSPYLNSGSALFPDRRDRILESSSFSPPDGLGVQTVISMGSGSLTRA